jgi:hypothetical protein
MTLAKEGMSLCPPRLVGHGPPKRIVHLGRALEAIRRRTGERSLEHCMDR